MLAADDWVARLAKATARHPNVTTHSAAKLAEPGARSESNRGVVAGTETLDSERVGPARPT